MKMYSFTFTDSQDVEIYTYKWEPDNMAPTGVVQIVHGISEHGARYEALARDLTASGYIVYAYDHRGHGKTAENMDNFGYAGDDGWNWMAKDLYRLYEIIKEENPDLPLFILGHSMGSYLLRQCMYQYASAMNVKGFLLSGTGGAKLKDLAFGISMCRILIMAKGRRAKSKLMNDISFGSYNSQCPEKRTAFDWLSRDTGQVDKYIADPYCGKLCSLGLFTDFFMGIAQVQKPENIKRIPKNIPIYIFSGNMDPVGDYSNEVKKLYQIYKDTGISNVILKLYEGGRHEMLNEINREEVIGDMLHWLELNSTGIN